MSLSRPSDHFDSQTPEAGIVQPKLGPVGYLRFFWRQLTSMRTALFLLLLLAFAAIPGSIVPQRSSDPNGVIQFKSENPGSFPILDALQVFNTYTSIWFSSIYLLLFISLIGCVIPRTRHHFAALRARPPKTPENLERLPAFITSTTKVKADAAIDTARDLLKSLGYRVEVFGSSVSAERGYLRETGNLVFHSALVGVLLAVGLGGGFGYTGQRVVVEGQKFVNVLGDYDSFNPGRFFNSTDLVPYRIALTAFHASYELQNKSAIGQPIDYTADVKTTTPGSGTRSSTIKVNSPLAIGGTDVYLLGNGYAPTIIVRDPGGNIVFDDSVPFLPQDPQLSSVGVVKVPDGLAQQIGMIGFFYPTSAILPSGALASRFPGLLDPVLTLQVYTGDLGLNSGTPRSVYNLDIGGLTAIAGGKANNAALQLSPGDRVDLPNGLGSIEFQGVKRFASLDIHHDPSGGWVLLFAILVIAGLFTSLFVPRRRVWVKATSTKSGARLEYAGLARGDDPRLDTALAEIAEKHAKILGLKLNS
jgi:cytochrome c biogenesis protein